MFDCTRKMFDFMFLCPNNFYIFSGTCSIPKLLKLTISFFYKVKQSNVYQYLHIHQGLFHKLILYFLRQIISRINPIKSWFILIILLHFKVCIKNLFHFHKQLLQFLDLVFLLSLHFLFSFHNQVLQVLSC